MAPNYYRGGMTALRCDLCANVGRSLLTASLEIPLGVLLRHGARITDAQRSRRSPSVPSWPLQCIPHLFGNGSYGSMKPPDLSIAFTTRRFSVGVHGPGGEP